jgi:hypothetical protein
MHEADGRPISKGSDERREGQGGRNVGHIGQPQQVSSPSCCLMTTLLDTVYVHQARCSGPSAVGCHICSVSRRCLLYKYPMCYTMTSLPIVYIIMSHPYFTSVKCILYSYMFHMRAR